MNWKRTGSATLAWLFVALAAVSARGADVPESAAAGADSIVVHDTNIKFFPYAYYTPETEFAVGAGLRYLFNKEEKVNLRVDFGVGRNTTGVYFGLEEAF